MSNLRTTSLLLVAVISSAMAYPTSAQQPSPASTRHYVIGLPNALEEESGKKVLRAILELIMTAGPADRIEIFNAQDLQQLADMTIPTGHLSKPRARVRRLGRHIGRVRDYLSDAQQNRSTTAGSIRLPQFFDLVGNIRGPKTIIVVGSPYYTDIRDGFYSFAPGSFPADGHLTGDVGSSVFNTVGKSDLLRDSTVHMCYLKEQFQTVEESYAVRRFWSLYTNQLGGTLATFNVAVNTTCSQAMSDSRKPVQNDPVNLHDRLVELLTIDSQSRKKIPLRDVSMVKQLENYRSAGRWHDAVSLLEDAVDSDSSRRFFYREYLYEAYLEAAQLTSEPLARRDQLVSALEIAEQFSLDAEPVRRQIEQIDEEVAHWKKFDKMVSDLRQRGQFMVLVDEVQERIATHPNPEDWLRRNARCSRGAIRARARQDKKHLVQDEQQHATSLRRTALFNVRDCWTRCAIS